MENFILRAIILAGLILAAFAVLLRKKPKHITSLKDKHVFITGGSSGIGLALAKLCLSQGAYVTLISKTRAKLINAYDVLTKTMGYPSDHIRFEAVDVGDAAAVSSAVKGSLNWRAIDILICNAGLACQGHLDEVEIKQLEYMARSNFLGCVFPLHAALPHIKSRSFHTPCSVIIMGSSASLAFIPEANIYTATKHALKGLADYLRVELMPYNIPVTFACPPFVETPMLDQGKSPYRRMFLLTMFGVMFVGEGEQNPCRELDEVDRAGRSAKLIQKLCFYDRSRAQSAEEVAHRVMEAAKRGEFLATTDIGSFILSVLGRGIIPADSLGRAICELLCMVPMRIISFYWFSYATRLLQRPKSHWLY